MADPAYTTTNRTSRAAEYQRQDGRGVLVLSPELLTRSEPQKQFDNPCGTPVEGTSAPHCTAGKTKHSKAPTSAVLKNSTE